MKKLIFILLLMICSNVFARHDDIWLQTSNELNKTLPRQHTQDLILDTTYYAEGFFVYNYSSIFKKSDFNEQFLKSYQINSKKSITNKACSTPLLKKMLSDNVTIKYMTFDSEGFLLSKISVSVKDCN